MLAVFITHQGGVSEWFKELVLKTSDLHGSVGSNPTPTAIFTYLARNFRFIRLTYQQSYQQLVKPE